MKEIKAILRPSLLTQVIIALKEHPGLPGVTVSEVKGFGKSQASDATDKVVVEAVAYAQKVQLEIVVPNDLWKEVVELIEKTTHTGRPGDGKIFVYDVQEVVKISDGERGENAI
ncbi:MAG: P-II family nitrogen regulator [Elusimicrobia bacterium]|jgi:nitrogen regulatory protein P-II 1|nr:P-II family nitrogen regulator [Elusimicrobiota bacterium]MBL0058419.1 P-II family nitrogen regulator [Elusimicrobiota bacterium]